MQLRSQAVRKKTVSSGKAEPSRNVAEVSVVSDPIEQSEVYVPPELAERMARRVPVEKPVVFGYARYSTDSQRVSSIERQIANIRAYADRAGLEIRKIFVDVATTGTTADREGMTDLLGECGKCRRSIVVVEEIDRFVRDMGTYADLILKFDRNSTELHDMTGHNPPAIEAFKAGMASEERERMLARTAAGRIASAKKGRWISNRVPYGYVKSEPGVIEIDPETSPNVVTIYELRVAGLNFRQIRDELHRRGIPGPVGPTWYAGTIKNILASEIYVGWCVWNLTDYTT